MNDSTVTIRKLLEPDAEIFQDLRLESLQVNPEAFGGTFEETRKMTLSEIEKRLNPGDGSYVLGAFANENLCGTSGFFRQKTFKTSHKGIIWGVYVTPAMRGKGISRALLIET